MRKMTCSAIILGVMAAFYVNAVYYPNETSGFALGFIEPILGFMFFMGLIEGFGSD